MSLARKSFLVFNFYLQLSFHILPFGNNMCPSSKIPFFIRCWIPWAWYLWIPLKDYFLKNSHRKQKKKWETPNGSVETEFSFVFPLIYWWGREAWNLPISSYCLFVFFFVLRNQIIPSRSFKKSLLFSFVRSVVEKWCCHLPKWLCVVNVLTYVFLLSIVKNSETSSHQIDHRRQFSWEAFSIEFSCIANSTSRCECFCASIFFFIFLFIQNSSILHVVWCCHGY